MPLLRDIYQQKLVDQYEKIFPIMDALSLSEQKMMNKRQCCLVLCPLGMNKDCLNLKLTKFQACPKIRSSKFSMIQLMEKKKSNLFSTEPRTFEQPSWMTMHSIKEQGLVSRTSIRIQRNKPGRSKKRHQSKLDLILSIISRLYER